MKKLSVMEFKRECEKINHATFIFDTENQSGNPEREMRLVAKYSEIIFMLNPNKICFKNGCNTLCLDRVKYVKHEEVKNMVGMVYEIVCGDSVGNFNETYTIVVDGYA